MAASGTSNRPVAHPGATTFCNGPDVFYTTNHYDILVSEPRIATYIGIAHGQIPPEAYFATMRTFPDNWDWQEMKPVGEHRTYMGIDVFEGAYTYRGMHIVPSWGGDMFEALMPDLFVPEASWAPRSWGINHALTVRAQREHGLDDAKYGYWGFSPASKPGGGYSEWGVDAIGMRPDGYPSDMERTNYDVGFAGVRAGSAPTPPGGTASSPLTRRSWPCSTSPARPMTTSSRSRPSCGPTATAASTTPSRSSRGHRQALLSLDQAMVLGAIGNVL